MVSMRSPHDTATMEASTVNSSFQVHSSENESTQGNQNLHMTHINMLYMPKPTEILKKKKKKNIN